MRRLLFLICTALLLLFGCSCATSRPKRAQITPFSLLFTPAAAAEQKIACEGAFCVPRYYLEGEIDAAAVRKMIAWLESAKAAGAKGVLIEINSPGGNVDDGFTLLRAIEGLGVPSWCVAEHEVASEAFAVLQSCTYRLMTKRTQLLTHGPKATVGGTAGSAELQNMADNMSTSERAHAEHCAHRMKISIEEYLKKTSGGRDWFMNWPEALAVGAVDRTVPDLGWAESHLRSGLALP